MPSTRRNRFFLIVALIAVSMGSLYHYWAQGRVISSLRHGSWSNPHTFRIREIPTDPPGLSDGYAYRCEVWWHGRLMKASTYRWDSFTARTTSITVGADGSSAVFHVGDHDISCSPYDARSDYRWEGGR